MVGNVVYSRAYRSRWAGSGAMARLTVDDATLVIEPLPPWKFLRCPVIRIPLASIARADRLPLGRFRFVTPSAPELDGTRFAGIVPGDDRLTTLAQELARRGLTGEPVPFATSWKEALGNQAVAQRPGLIWRDRGWRAFAESALILAIPTGIAYWTGVFSGPNGLPIWLIGVAGVLSAAWWIAGHRLRRK